MRCLVRPLLQPRGLQGEAVQAYRGRVDGTSWVVFSRVAAGLGTHRSENGSSISARGDSHIQNTQQAGI